MDHIMQMLAELEQAAEREHQAADQLLHHWGRGYTLGKLVALQMVRQELARLAAQQSREQAQQAADEAEQAVNGHGERAKRVPF